MGYEVFIVENTTQRVRKVIHFTMLEFTPFVHFQSIGSVHIPEFVAG